jgi:hypothetical protein
MVEKSKDVGICKYTSLFNFFKVTKLDYHSTNMHGSNGHPISLCYNEALHQLCGVVKWI